MTAEANMLTPQQIDFLYQLLDQVNLRGEEQKMLALTTMQSLRQMAEQPVAPKISELIVPPEDDDAEGD